MKNGTIKSLSILWTVIISIWVLLEILNYLGFKFLANTKFIGLIIFLGIGLLLSLIYLVYNQKIIIKLNFKEKAFEFSDIDNIVIAFKKNKFNDVIDKANSISRELYIQGHYKLRYDVGLLVEESSAKLNDKFNQVKALIDYIGWSLVLLDNLERNMEMAINNINYGIEISQTINAFFWTAKGYRHLSRINIIMNDYIKAEEFSEMALESAHKIQGEKERDEMIAGIQYNIAIASFYQKKLENANKFCQLSMVIYKKANDNSRLCKVYSLMAQIEETRNNLPLAKDLYRKSMYIAQKINRRDEILKNHLGLSRIMKNEGQFSDFSDFYLSDSI